MERDEIDVGCSESTEDLSPGVPDLVGHKDSGPVGVSTALTGLAVSVREKPYPRVAGGKEAPNFRRIDDSGNGGFARFSRGILG